LHLPESAFRLVRELEGALRVYHNRVMNAPDIGRESAAREPDLDNNKLLEVSRALWTFGARLLRGHVNASSLQGAAAGGLGARTTYLSNKT
jgi:hypothetical protein